VSTCHGRKAGRERCRDEMSGRDDESCDIMRHHATSCDIMRHHATSCDITRHHAIGSGSGSGAGGVRRHSSEGVAEERRGGGSGSGRQAGVGSGSGRRAGVGSGRGSPYSWSTNKKLNAIRVFLMASSFGKLTTGVTLVERKPRETENIGEINSTI